MPTSVADVVAKSATGHPLPTLRSGEANVSDTERVVSLAAGGLLAGLGMTTSGLPRILLTVAGGALAFRGISGWCGMYSALGMNTACGHGPNTAVKAGHGVKVEESVTVNRPPSDLFSFWRQFSRLPQFMTHLKEVRESGPSRSHWVATGPLGTAVEWDAEVYNERPYELIAWRSLPGSDIDTAGSVHFARAGAGNATTVHVVLKYDPPAGKVGHAVAKFFGEDPAAQIRDDLRRFKQLMEGGRS